MLNKSFFFIFCSLIILSNSLAKAQHIQMTVKELRSAKGQIVLNIYKDESGYEKEQAFKTLKFEKKNVVNGSMTIHLTLESGEYAIALIDDENKNSELDKNFIRIPKEGFGFSDFFMEKLKKPSFQDFKKQIKSGDNTISIRVKYL